LSGLLRRLLGRLRLLFRSCSWITSSTAMRHLKRKRVRRLLPDGRSRIFPDPDTRITGSPCVHASRYQPNRQPCCPKPSHLQVPPLRGTSDHVANLPDTRRSMGGKSLKAQPGTNGRRLARHANGRFRQIPHCFPRLIPSRSRAVSRSCRRHRSGPARRPASRNASARTRSSPSPSPGAPSIPWSPSSRQ